MGKFICVFVVALLSFACADPSQVLTREANWGVSGYVRSPEDGKPVAQSLVQVRSLGEDARINVETTTAKDGFFHVEIPPQQRALELELNVSQQGWAGSKIQSVWIEGQRFFDIEQVRGSGVPPRLFVDDVVPYQIVSSDGAGTDVVLRAVSDGNIEQLSLSVLGGEVLDTEKSSRMAYHVNVGEFPRQGDVTLVARAVDGGGNRSEVYLPVRRQTEGARAIDAPGQSAATRVEASSLVVADSADPSSALQLKVDFSIPRPSAQVKAVRVYRGQGGAFRELAYVKQLAFGDFVYRDESEQLTPGKTYQYRFAYDGEEYSSPGAVVPVVLLPVYAVTLVEPEDGRVVSSGSNVLFRWLYRFGDGDIPQGTSREESFSVYPEGDWGSREDYATSAEPWSAAGNAMSLPLSRFPLGVRQLWNVASSIRYQSSSSSGRDYWLSKSQSSPSVDDDYAGNGFAAFIREVVQ